MSLPFSGIVSAGAAIGINSLLVKPKRGIYNTDGTQRASIPIPQATIQETMHDDLEITDHPVEQGASISDHAYKLPAELTIKAAWSNSPSSTGGLSGLLNSGIALGAATVPKIAQAVNLYQQASAAVGVVNAITSSQSGTSQGKMNAIYSALLGLQQADPKTKSIPLVDIYTGRRIFKNMVLKSMSVENDFKTENALFATLTFKQINLVSTQLANSVGPTAPAEPKANATPTQSGLQKLSSSVQNFINVPSVTSVTKLFG